MHSDRLLKFEQFVKEHSLDDVLEKDFFFTINSLYGELGEVSNVLKKREMYDIIPEYKKRVDRELAAGFRIDFQEQLVEELGDSFFFLIKLLQQLDIPLEEIIEAQENKIIGQSIANGRAYKK